MRHIATLPYDDIDFVWVNNHYDVHISGLCRLGFGLFYFKTINHESYFEDDDKELMCEIYDLTFREDIKWRLKKFFFEQMVGYHWSYPTRKNSHFHYRKPEWLYKILFWLYYKVKFKK
jgi:hypothetical protein